MEKVTRRVVKRWTGTHEYITLKDITNTVCFSDYSQDHADLGAALNGFSLSERDELSGAIEKTGQAIDATYMSTTKLVSNSLL